MLGAAVALSGICTDEVADAGLSAVPAMNRKTIDVVQLTWMTPLCKLARIQGLTGGYTAAQGIMRSLHSHHLNIRCCLRIVALVQSNKLVCV